MSWQELCQQGRMTAEQIVSHIKSNDRVVVAHAAGEPGALTDAIVRGADAYHNIGAVHMVAIGEGEHCPPEYTENFRHNSLPLGASTRDVIAKGHGDSTPVYFSQIPDLLREKLHPNVALLHLSPSDEHDYCSYNVLADYTKPATEIADLRTAQINPSMPRTLGGSFIHISELNCIVEVDDPVIELGQAKIGKTECAIGKRCASLVQDGDCLQLDIGAIPNAVLLFLKEKKDPGIHSGMLSDDVVELVEAGVITNRRKTLHKGQCVVTFLMDNERLYDYINNNPPVATYPVNYVNNSTVIAKSDNLVSINSCIQIGLMGQIVSNSIGPRQFSGVGGQINFVRSTNLSCGGKSIIAMPSPLVKKGDMRVSKIAVQIDADAAVTTSRYDVNYIVTEFGAARLKSKALRDRAKVLVKIAHPDFREELMEEFHRRLGV